MVPNDWKGKDVRIKQAGPEPAGDARLEEVTDNGVVMTWQDDDGADRRVFFPWHIVEAIELTDPRGPAEPRIGRLGI